jgi:tripartite-type tricarboxylate transporter receptor subunit TctC
LRIAIAACLGMIAMTAGAQQYPTRPVKIIVSVSAGGAPDLAARAIATRLTKPLGQPVVVENRGGANGNVAGQLVAEAPADGYTLLLAPDSLLVVNPYLYKNMPFDPRKDLVPLSTIIRNQFVLAVNPKVPAKTLKEFVEYAKHANPPLAYASAGNGSQHHLLMEMLKAYTGIDMLHVPYKGGAPAVAATVAGDTMATFSGGPSTAPHVRAGRLRVLAGSGSHRSEVLPDVPTVGEFYPGYEGVVWSAMYAPGGTPQPIVTRLHNEINRVLADPEVKAIFRKAGGTESYITTPEEFAQIIRKDSAKYSKLISNLKLSVAN